MHESNTDLARAFPTALRKDALRGLAVFPESPRRDGTFSVQVAGEVVEIPNRIYHDPELIRMRTRLPWVWPNRLQKELGACLLTRHASGFVREEHLKRIICANYVWIPPFVIQLVGEYVIEILHAVQQNLTNLDKPIYMQFLKNNPQFFGRTEQRVISYWNCYYRDCKRSEYVGFRVLEFFKSLAEEARGLSRLEQRADVP